MDRRKTILHLGMGAFHRAHQAVYLQRLLASGDDSWTLASGNIRDDQAAVEQALVAQGGRYTVESVSPSGVRTYLRIDAISTVVPYAAPLQGLIEIGIRTSTRIVSFTVTEAGYSGDTLYRALSALLAARRTSGAGRLTLLNCDNLRNNGNRAREGLLQFLDGQGEADLADWVRTNTSWPNSMVDRITPRPTPDIRIRVLAATGWDDAAPVMAEDFAQWVVEDDFCNGRPDWKAVGVEMVDSVAPYEEAKIRILNATHSCLAWAGVLAGYRYIHEAVRDPRILRFAHDYSSKDVLPCLRPSPVDLPAYRDVALSRFGNAALADSNERVVADGFAKLPGFIVPTLRENLAAGRRIDSVARLPALFLAFLQRWHRGELPFEYRDQAMDPDVAHAICSAADPVQALCRNVEIWGDIAGDPRLIAAVHLAQCEIERFLMTPAHA